MVKVLIYGGTGQTMLLARNFGLLPAFLSPSVCSAGALGSLISEACVKEGHTTYVVIRASTRGSKAGLCSKLEAAGVRLVEGDFTGQL